MTQETKLDDGGSAFPVDVDAMFWGMSLRDYFAAKAMPVLLEMVLNSASNPTKAADLVPMSAYEMADAMINARRLP